MLLATLMAVSGCDEDPSDAEQAALDFEREAPIIAEQSMHAVGSTDDFARLADFFRVRSNDYDPADTDDAIFDSIVQRAYLRIPNCLERRIIDATAVEITGVGAQAQCDTLEVTGQLLVRAFPVREPCSSDPTQECLVAVRWALQADGVQVVHKDEQWFDSTFDGALDVIAPIDPQAEVSWTIGDALVTQLSIGEYAMVSDAVWSVATDDCLALDLDAHLELIELGAEVDPALQPLVETIYVAAQGVTRCGNACPVAGTVLLSYGGGQLLRWSYDADGEAQVEIEAPGSRTLTFDMPCQPPA